MSYQYRKACADVAAAAAAAAAAHSYIAKTVGTTRHQCVHRSIQGAPKKYPRGNTHSRHTKFSTLITILRLRSCTKFSFNIRSFIHLFNSLLKLRPMAG